MNGAEENYESKSRILLQEVKQQCKGMAEAAWQAIVAQGQAQNSARRQRNAGKRKVQ
jgi:hypothetical protein